MFESFLFSFFPFSKHTLFSTVFLLSYTLFHSREETPVNLVGSELSLSRKLPLNIPKTSSNTQTALPLSPTFSSRALQITQFYSLASLQALVPHPLPSHLISLNLHYPVRSSSTQTLSLLLEPTTLCSADCTKIMSQIKTNQSLFQLQHYPPQHRILFTPQDQGALLSPIYLHLSN